jgi:succinate dehydrogenase/fumarate reductase flavoprotein subunit
MSSSMRADALHNPFFFNVHLMIGIMVPKIESDVLVLGSGGAGLRAAIEAEANNLSVVVVSKAPIGMNNATVVSAGGFRAAIEGLTPQDLFKDTIEVGKGINDTRLVEVFAKESGDRVLELKHFGVDMRIHQGGISVGDIPGLRGLALTKPLVNYARSHGIRFSENVIITKLLIDESIISGAIGYDAQNDQPIIFSAKAVVLATGGAGALYKRTDCPLRTTGDGYSLAYKAGAKLQDMEFVQFHPFGLAEQNAPPYLVRGPIREKGHIINSLGEDIPKKHKITARPLGTKSRDLLSRAMMIEILEGKGIDGAVFLDATELFKRAGLQDEEEWFSTTHYIFFRDKLKAAERPLRIAPICHFCMGGVSIDEYCNTGVPGLYAAGEVVGGIHGANRHGGNALTDIIVFGARAGAAAAEYAKKRNKVLLPNEIETTERERYVTLREREASKKGNPREIMTRLRETMWLKVGILRDELKLQSALSDITNLKKAVPRLYATSGRMMIEALEVLMALEVAEMICRAALKRTESRGAHYRTDYPMMDNLWMKKIIISRNADGEMQLRA